MILDTTELPQLKLPKTKLHDMFGVCWDKKDTYTITELSRQDFDGKKPITISSVLKKAGINFTNDKQTVIVFSYIDTWRDYGVGYFNIDVDKKVLSYGGSLYRKGDVTSSLKEAQQIIIIEADYNSLKYRNSDWKDDFRRSSKFNDDFSLYERVKIKGNYTYKYNEETEQRERIPITESEIRNKTTRSYIEVQFISSGRNLTLRKTIGNLYDDELWGEMIDKSGYNRNAKLVHNHFALESFKAKKMAERIKNGEILGIQTEIVNLISECKEMIGNSLLKQETSLPNLIENTETSSRNLRDLNWEIKSFRSVNEHISEVGTDHEYSRYTLKIIDNLKTIKNNLIEIKGKIEAGQKSA